MFKLSTRADYGLILLSNLAHSKKFVSVSTVAKKNKISPKFLSQIAQELKKAGFVIAKEGVFGGYGLAKDPKEITLLDVLKVLDGELVEGRCFEAGHECVCGAKGMWMDLKKDLEKSFGEKTVADLVKS